jgi:hypothetical protein
MQSLNLIFLFTALFKPNNKIWNGHHILTTDVMRWGSRGLYVVIGSREVALAWLGPGWMENRVGGANDADLDQLGAGHCTGSGMVTLG